MHITRNAIVRSVATNDIDAPSIYIGGAAVIEDVLIAENGEVRVGTITAPALLVASKRLRFLRVVVACRIFRCLILFCSHRKFVVANNRFQGGVVGYTVNAQTNDAIISSTQSDVPIVQWMTAVAWNRSLVIELPTVTWNSALLHVLRLVCVVV
jgi:hypothetical protein